MSHHHHYGPEIGDPDPVLSALVFTALGEASMCWAEPPRGVFDADRAHRIGVDLIAAIRRRGYR